MNKILLFILLFSFVGVVNAAPVENFGQNLSGLQQAFANRNVHFLQIGDSHTAGDYFTEQLRKRLQAETGDGGIGFGHAGKVHNQRTARHDYINGDWYLSNSRSQAGDFALGGIMAASGIGSPLTLTSQYYAGDTQNAKIVVKGRAGQMVSIQDRLGNRVLTLTQTGWQTLSTKINFPTRIVGDVSIGGFWLTKGSGGVVSAMGINGALQSVWGNWRSGVSQDLAVSGANLVILAYGTNEAFSPNYSPSVHKRAMINAITQIKRGLPNANILLINAPESLKSTGGQCGTRGTHLDSVRQQIRAVAQEYGTLYWDWQTAMGGACSMKSWINGGLATKDGVHFTRAGYERAANDLYSNLKAILNTPVNYTYQSAQPMQYQTPQNQTIPNYATPNQPHYVPQTPTYTPPKQGVCIINGKSCNSIR